VGVEKVHFPQNSQNLGDGKCLGKPRKSFVGLPNCKVFSGFSGDGVFQQPQAFTLKTPVLPGSMSEMAILRQPSPWSRPPTPVLRLQEAAH
jgi:hypothetical protein